MIVTNQEFDFLELPSDGRLYSKANTNMIARSSFTFKTFKRKDGTSIKKATYLNLYLGINLLKRIGLEEDDHVKLFIERSNSRIWFLKKSVDNKGRKLIIYRQHTGAYSQYYRIQYPWKQFSPTEEETKLTELRTQIQNDGLILFFDQSKSY